MGFNTTVLVLNDALTQIEQDPKFGLHLADAIRERNSFRNKLINIPAGNHGNAVAVIETHHADELHAVLIGGNTGDDLGWVGRYTLDIKTLEGRKDLLREMAVRLGLDIAIRKGK